MCALQQTKQGDYHVVYWYLDDLADEPRDRLELELGDVVIESLEEELIFWFRKDHSREQIRDDSLRTTQRDLN